MENKVQWAVVTGASSGIGYCYAQALAKRGINVFVTARRKDRLDQLKEHLQSKYGVEIEVFVCDLLEENAPQKIFDAASAGGRSIDILINNAGLGHFGNFLENKYDDHRVAMSINMERLSSLIWLFAKSMLNSKNSCYIQNIASISSFISTPKLAVYAATKAYVHSLSRALATEWRDTNIKISCLCPGLTTTEFMERADWKLGSLAAKGAMSSECVVEMGCQALFSGKMVKITGFTNWMYVLLSRFVPYKIVIALFQRMLGTKASV
mgnify:CR=1 FL=1